MSTYAIVALKDIQNVAKEESPSRLIGKVTNTVIEQHLRVWLTTQAEGPVWPHVLMHSSHGQTGRSYVFDPLTLGAEGLMGQRSTGVVAFND